MENSSFVHSFRLDNASSFRYNDCRYWSCEKFSKIFRKHWNNLTFPMPCIVER